MPPEFQAKPFSISIIAPCMNEERYIGEFLSSIACQHSKLAEVVIVDGGSTDRSIQIIDEWKKRVPFNIIVVNEQKHNIGFARNLGAKHSTGDILFHTGADVFFHDSNFFEKIASFYEDERVFAVSGATYEVGGMLKRTRLIYEFYHLARWILCKMPFPVKRYSLSANYLSIRRDVFEDLDGFPIRYVNEDGFLGRMMLKYARRTGRRLIFSMKNRVCDHPTRFNSMGWRVAMQYYFYILPNVFPFLDNWLSDVHKQSALAFKKRLHSH